MKIEVIELGIRPISTEIAEKEDKLGRKRTYIKKLDPPEIRMHATLRVDQKLELKAIYRGGGMEWICTEAGETSILRNWKQKQLSFTMPTEFVLTFRFAGETSAAPNKQP